MPTVDVSSGLGGGGGNDSDVGCRRATLAVNGEDVSVSVPSVPESLEVRVARGLGRPSRSPGGVDRTRHGVGARGRSHET